MNDIESSYPLSPLQQGMLFHHLLGPGSGVDILQMVCTLTETIDSPTLQAAWQKIVARHEILRTGFRWEGLEEPVQEVYRQVALSFMEEDWSALTAGKREEHLHAFLQADRKLGLAMDHAPMMRWNLLRFSAQESRLVWTFHHALLDGRSFTLLIKEVFSAYDAMRQGRELELEVESPRPYRHFIEWLSGQDLEASETFWRQVLKGFHTPTPLVVAKPAAGHGSQTHETGWRQADQEIWLSEATTSQLRTLAKEHELTLNTFLQGAWAILLSRYSGEPDVVFGATRACRKSSLQGADSMVGLFINTLPVRAQVDPNQALLPWLAQLRNQWVAMRKAEHTPLVKVQGWSDVPPGTPLFESILVFENYRQSEAIPKEGDQWAGRHLRLYDQTNFPITLAAYDGAQLSFRIGFDCTRLETSAIERMLGHLKCLLEAMAAQPHQKLGQLPMLCAEEREQLVVQWAPAAKTPSRSITLHAWFEAQARNTPEAIALSFEGSSLTYRALNRQANQLAHELQSLGVGPDVIVGICMDRSFEMIVGILGILKAGGAYLPIDLAYPQERLAFMIQDSGAQVLISQRKLSQRLPGQCAKILYLDEALAQLEDPDQNPDSQAGADHLAYVIFTSGSTGKPKGTLITHRNVVRLMDATQPWFGFNQKDVWTLFHSYAFDFSVWELWGALLYGGRLVVVSYNASRSPEAFHQLLRDQHVTVLNQTPSAFRQLVQVDQSQSQPLDLRWVIFGGEALELQSLRPWFERHGQERPQLVNMYGITETTVHVTFRPIRLEDQGSLIGVPIPDLQLYILDPQGQPTPIGIPGELHVAGAGLARGYLNRPDLTAQTFIANAFSQEAGARLYRTGDLARYLPNRDIEYLGRIDHQVKIRGFRIELGEIESVACQHPAIREATVLVREDQPGDKRLVAYLVSGGAQPNISELRDFMHGKLPEYMVPASVVFLDALPLTHNGKVDRKALPAPSEHRPDLARAFTPAETPVQQALASIWASVLRLDRVGIDDNFFELGGHSLLATQVMSRIFKVFRTQVPLRCLFESATVSGLSRHLVEREPKPGQTETIARALLRIEAMSREERDKRLARISPHGPS